MIDISENIKTPTSKFVKGIVGAYKKTSEPLARKDFHELTPYEQKLVSIRYYNGENDILKRKRIRINEHGEEIEMTRLANNRIAHPFYNVIVDQIVNYMMSREPSFHLTNETDHSRAYLKNVLEETFSNELKQKIEDAVKTGEGFFQVYYDEFGDIRFKRIPSDEVLVVETINGVEAVARFYTVNEYADNGSLVQTERIEWITDSDIKIFGSVPGNNRELDLIESIEHYYLVNPETGESVGHSFGKMPIIRLINNFSGKPKLSLIKTKIDAYDLTVSDLINNIQDTPMGGILKVRDYGGSAQDREQIKTDISQINAVFVEGTGDVEYIFNKLDINAVRLFLERTRDEIMAFAQTVDTNNMAAGNPSGTALQFRFTGLDMESKAMEIQVNSTMKQVKVFLEHDIALKGLDQPRTETRIVDGMVKTVEVPGITDIDFSIMFNTTRIFNQREQAEIAARLNQLDWLPKLYIAEMLNLPFEFIQDMMREMEEEKLIDQELAKLELEKAKREAEMPEGATELKEPTE